MSVAISTRKETLKAKFMDNDELLDVVVVTSHTPKLPRVYYALKFWYFKKFGVVDKQ